MIKKIIFIIFFCLLAVLKSTDIVAEEANTSEYFPLNEGDSWTYETYISAENGSLRGTTTMVVNSKEILDIMEVYPMESTGPDDEKNIFYYSVDKDTVYLHKIFKSGRYIEFSPPIRFPIVDLVRSNSKEEISAVVKMYATDSQFIDQGTFEATVKFDGFENIDVPAGSFERCIKIFFLANYKIGNSEAEITRMTWVAKGIGKVKETEVEKYMVIENGQRISSEIYRNHELKSTKTK